MTALMSSPPSALFVAPSASASNFASRRKYFRGKECKTTAFSLSGLFRRRTKFLQQLNDVIWIFICCCWGCNYALHCYCCFLPSLDFFLAGIQPLDGEEEEE